MKKIEIKVPKIRQKKSIKSKEIDPKVSGRSMSRLWRFYIGNYRTVQNFFFLQTAVQSEKFRRRNKEIFCFFVSY
jgi:hypothetical protein